MGAKQRNFHKELMARMGFEAEADEIQELFFAGKRDEAVAAVPTRSPTRSRSSARRRASATGSRRGRSTAVTTMIVSADPDTMRVLAELVA